MCFFYGEVSLKSFFQARGGLPCGKIFFGERLEDAVRRELLEETALPYLDTLNADCVRIEDYKLAAIFD
jgi:hypothetical protein